MSEFDIGQLLSSHDHILSIFDLVRRKGRSFQIMEYLPYSLGDWMMNMEGVPTEEEAACVFRQMLDAVSYMHLNGVAHLDLKLQNVMFTGEGPDRKVKVIDFGCSARFIGLDGDPVLMRGTPFRTCEPSRS